MEDGGGWDGGGRLEQSSVGWLDRMGTRAHVAGAVDMVASRLRLCRQELVGEGDPRMSRLLQCCSVAVSLHLPQQSGIHRSSH